MSNNEKLAELKSKLEEAIKIVNELSGEITATEDAIAQEEAAAEAESYFAADGTAVKELPDGTEYYSVVFGKKPPQKTEWGLKPSKDAMRLRNGRVFKDRDSAEAFLTVMLAQQTFRKHGAVMAGTLALDADVYFIDIEGDVCEVDAGAVPPMALVFTNADAADAANVEAADNDIDTLI